MAIDIDRLAETNTYLGLSTGVALSATRLADKFVEFVGICPHCATAPLRVTGTQLRQGDQGFDSDAICIKCSTMIGILIIFPAIARNAQAHEARFRHKWGKLYNHHFLKMEE